MHPTTFRALACALVLTAACNGEKKPAEENDPDGSVVEPEPGLTQVDGGWIFRTEPITLGPTEEKFVCYAASVPEDMAITRYSSKRNAAIHHFLFVEARMPEPSGWSTCDTLFRPTWLPMYPATTADSELSIPDGAAKLVASGSQLVLQLHFLNTTNETVTTHGEVQMNASPVSDPEPVGITLFGTGNLSLPAMRGTTIENTCTLKADTQLYAVLPHMHYLGRKLELLFGPDESQMELGYVRDPYDFNDQRFDPLERLLPAGSKNTIRCTYENDSDDIINFGENAEAEMCLAVGFRVGGNEFEFCGDEPTIVDGGVPRAPDSGVCGEVISDEGVGALCTKAGGECASNLFCTADLLDAQEGVCFRVGCDQNVTCGDRMTCCTVPVVGSFANVCLPEACRPEFCIPVE